MPIFEYRCGNCKEIFEILQFTSSEKVTVLCPFCQSRKARRVMSVFSGKIRDTASQAGSGCSSCSASSCQSCSA